VWTCCKNNDGELGSRTAWERCNGLFRPVHDFDWQGFDDPDGGRKSGITKAQVAAVFKEGKVKLPRAVAEKRLEELTGRTKSPCYEALKADGKFAEHLTEEDGLMAWTP
jgi:hypothetical protein